MFEKKISDERKRVQERYKEYDGTYLGHYVQYFFWFFFVLGFVFFGLAIFLMLDSHYHWTNPRPSKVTSFFIIIKIRLLYS